MRAFRIRNERGETVTNILLRRLTPGAALLLMLAAFVCATPPAQEMKTRELLPAFDFTKIEMPVELVSIKLNGEAIEPGRKIQAGDDWLRGLTFTLKNISDKPIAYVEVALQFQHADDPRDYTVYLLSYGLEPAHGGNDAAPKAAPRPIQPGETVDLALSNDKYPGLQNMLARTGVASSVEVARYFIDRIFFDGEPDVMLRGGTVWRRDANDTYKFNKVERYSLPSKPAGQD
jgi:hypothetical protein